MKSNPFVTVVVKIVISLVVFAIGAVASGILGELVGGFASIIGTLATVGALFAVWRYQPPDVTDE